MLQRAQVHTDVIPRGHKIGMRMGELYTTAEHQITSKEVRCFLLACGMGTVKVNKLHLSTNGEPVVVPGLHVTGLVAELINEKGTQLVDGTFMVTRINDFRYPKPVMTGDLLLATFKLRHQRKQFLKLDIEVHRKNGAETEVVHHGFLTAGVF